VSRTWRDLREEARGDLERASSPNAANEARWIIEQASGLRGSDLAAGEHEIAPAVAATKVTTMTRRRIDGEPLQYVLGEWSFRGIELFVDPRVLIPRPETELTAQVAIDEAVAAGARRGRNDAWTGAHDEFIVVDLGTGSGALAIALAAELPDAEVWATDISTDALAVARANVAGNAGAATRIRLGEGDLFTALPDQLRGHVRLVVSNPPYVAEYEVDALPTEVVAYEPLQALVSGPTGMEVIERIIAEAASWLAPDGALVVELAPHQAEGALELAGDAGFASSAVKHDLAGRERVLVARVQ
jgi:release factor glutamine methyltransferase